MFKLKIGDFNFLSFMCAVCLFVAILDFDRFLWPTGYCYWYILEGLSPKQLTSLLVSS